MKEVVADLTLENRLLKKSMIAQKLLGYGNPRVFFHLTYAYVEDKAALMRFLETSAETASPPGFNFLAIETIPHEDSRPPGFVARYSAEFGEVKVIFLVLNLGQQRQLLAAKTAGATKARKAPDAKKTHRNYLVAPSQ